MLRWPGRPSHRLNAGFTQAILTAKHHDGFLLFPSKYSTFTVASSSWAGGSGDVVRSFTNSAHKFGMKVGIYISPADLHEVQAGGRFANGSAKSTRTIPGDSSEIVNGQSFQVSADDYNTYFMDTLYELLTRYGTVDEVWWDGANPTGANEGRRRTHRPDRVRPRRQVHGRQRRIQRQRHPGADLGLQR